MQDRLLVTFTKMVLILREIKCGNIYIYIYIHTHTHTHTHTYIYIHGHCSKNDASWKVKKKNKEMTVERK